MEFFRDLFKTDFMPHGHCYLWHGDVLWSNVLGDAVIVLAYYAIPFLLYYFVRKRGDVRNFASIFFLFAAFIFFCGTTHILSIISVWVPVYRLEGLVKILTGIISLYTAYTLFRIMPMALTIPSADQMREKNEELQKAYEDLKYKTNELERQNKFMGQLAFATYHDLREPVRGMSMNSQLLLHKYSDKLDDEVKTILNHISAEGKKMYNTVDSILQFTFLQSETYVSEQVALEKIMGIVEKNLGQQIRDTSTSIEYSVLPVVKGNERLLIILFENVISNSINFRSDQTPLIRIAATADETHHIITIADNGTGFDNVYHEKIFEMFQRLGNQTSGHHGAGLGLSLCRRITEILRGAISADSAAGMGTVITIRLPKG